ncbi:MHYT domain-containing protein [Aquabacterium sp.]|uniref:MHYT domain-containing protein n=1 Tax=Aquabacterium sp. TaxID=1872578 RepID=UPI003B6CCB1B
MDTFFWLDRPGFDPHLLMYGDHDPWLVVLSVGLAIFASTMGLQAAQHARTQAVFRQRMLTLLVGSVSLGGGVWAMHFIGMLAFRLCTTVSYDPLITVLSMLPSVGASWIALNLLTHEHIDGRQLTIAGVLVGAGIGAMHYTGMAAMRLAPLLRYDPWMFALSIVVAVSLAIVALWVKFGLAARFPNASPLGLTGIAGTVMGLAISGMHYTGMAAARFIGTPTSTEELSSASQLPMALSIALAMVVFTVMSAAIAGLARYRQLLAQMASKQARLRAITETATDGIVVFDHLGIIHKFNPSAERIFGRAAEDMLGHSITTVMIAPYKQMAETSFPQFLGEIERAMGQEVETHCIHTDGRRIPLRLVMGRMKSLQERLYVAFLTDISERKRMEEALRDSEAQFRSLIGNIPGISYRCRVEPGWPMVYISSATERITGWPASAFMGATPEVRFADLVSTDDVRRIADIVKRATDTDQQFVLEFQLRTRQGDLRWMWGNGSIVRASDQSVMWIDGVLLDITERREMENELVEAKNRAEAAAVARSTFLANMSHEIRTPMNAIIGFTEVVLNGPLEAEQRRHLETVHKSARSLLYLLNDILDTSKLDRGAVELESLVFSLPDLIQQLCAEQSIQAGRKNLVLRSDCATSAGVVRGDPHRLRQVLLNLVGNAIKFTEHGEVSLSCEREGDWMHFAVQDTGIGIAPERLATIFEAFTQADASMSRRFGGTGLGTTIAKQLTELMGGRIWVESRLGQGSTFHVVVPLPACDAPVNTSMRPESTALQLPPMRILVVDDVPQNTELLCVVLGRQGHHLVVAHDGQEALARYAEGPVDVVLMDVQMPVMDGLSACRAIRRLEQEQGRPHTPVIALSASVQESDRAAALDAGMDGFAHKPLDMVALMHEISRVTGMAGHTITSDAHAGATSVATPSIWLDMPQGLARWGDAQAYHRALQQFSQQQQAWLLAPEQVEPPVPLDALIAQAHRLKGAASNLGLIGLSQHAAVLERFTPDTPAALRTQAWANLREAIEATLTALAAVTSPLPPDAATTQAASPGPSAAQRQAWVTQAEQLRQGFVRGECLEPLFTQFCLAVQPHVSGAVLNTLVQANDDFDFDAAAQALVSLQDALRAKGPHDV